MVIKFEFSLVTKLFSFVPFIVASASWFRQFNGEKAYLSEGDWLVALCCTFIIYFTYANKIVFYEDRMQVRSAFDYWEMDYSEMASIVKRVERGGVTAYDITSKAGEKCVLDTQFYNSSKVMGIFYQKIEHLPIAATPCLRIWK